MASNHTKRRLIWHGAFLFILGLLSGVIIPLMTNPRVGVSAHVAGVLNGMSLILVGLIWFELGFSGRIAITTFWLMVYATYSGWVALLLAAFLGTSHLIPIAGAGHQGAWWQESLVVLLLVTSSVAFLIGWGLVLFGLKLKHNATETK